VNLSHEEQSTLEHSYHFDNTCPVVSCKNEKDISGTPDIQITSSVITVNITKSMLKDNVLNL